MAKHKKKTSEPTPKNEDSKEESIENSSEETPKIESSETPVIPPTEPITILAEKSEKDRKLN